MDHYDEFMYNTSDASSIYDTESVVTKPDGTKKKKEYDTKRGHHLIHRYLNKKDGGKRKVPIELYTTRSNLDSRIRNAVTGFYEEAFVGRPSQDQCFKVVLATGELGKDAPSNFLFYDSPEQYERHFFLELEQSFKEKWYERQQAIRDSYNNDPEHLVDPSLDIPLPSLTSNTDCRLNIPLNIAPRSYAYAAM